MPEIITPGYSWSEGVPYYEDASRLGFSRKEHHNLREMFPLPNAETMQKVWDKKEISTDSGASIVEFNPDAEEGTIVWLPGWGVSSLRDGGSRVAVAMAALNPNRKIVTAEEIQNPKPEVVIAASAGDLVPYAKQYAQLFDRVRGPYVASGHSRGAVIHSILAAAGDTFPDALMVAEAPGYKRTVPVLKFALDVGRRDNKVHQNYMRKPHLLDVTTEAKLDAVRTNSPEASDTPLDVLERARSEWHIIKGMSHQIMPSVLRKIAAQGDVPIFIWHGTENVGSPINAVRQTVHGLQQDFPGIVRYFEAKTGHYSVGHTARFARQTAFVVSQVLKAA